MTATVRTFDTGATRDLDATKLDFEGFLSPAVLERYGRYMHKHRELTDGTMRDSDNWQRGMPKAVYMKSGWRHFFDWWRELLTNPMEAKLSDIVGRFGSAIPTGVFNNQQIETFLREIFTMHGRSNDFRKLERALYVVAVDLDSGEAVRFGGPGWDDVPISQAIQASAALPGLYSPVDIRGHHFVDGALRRTMHASVVLDHGIDLMIGINPFVPFNASSAKTQPSGMKKLAEGGLPVVLSQTFRTLLQSRMQVGLAKYAQQYPQVDQMVFEPNDDDGEMFFANVFSFDSRQRVCEHAYQSTLRDLRKRKAELDPVLAKHGLKLRDEVLNSPSSSIMHGLQKPIRQTDATALLRRALDDIEHSMRLEALS